MIRAMFFTVVGAVLGYNFPTAVAQGIETFQTLVAAM
jgi:hypothetical protein